MVFKIVYFLAQRIHGAQVAEIPLIGTRFQYQRRGMCRLLISMLEKVTCQMFIQFASNLGSVVMEFS